MLSSDAKKSIIKILTGQSSSNPVTSQCYIGLLTKEPTLKTVEIPGGGYVKVLEGEVEGEGYKRTLIGVYNAGSTWVMSEADETGKSVNTKTVFFPEAEADWGTITHFAFFKAESGETEFPFMWGELTEPVAISTGYVPLFKEGALSITLV